jgi:hypothetical protein
MSTDAQLCDFLRNRLEQQPQRRVEPSVSLLQGFRYTPSHQTDIRHTLDRAREQLKESKQ